MARAKGRAAARRARKGPGTSQATVLNVLQRHKLNIGLTGSNTGAFRNQPGPTGLSVSPNVVQEQVPGATVGFVTVQGPPFNYAFSVHDEFENGSMWIVQSNLLRLAPGQQVFFADAATRTLDITATAPNGRFVTVPVQIIVQQQIVPPPPNQAPTDILMDSLDVDEHTFGAPVGNYTVIDPDLPADTETVTISDARFVSIPSGTPGVGSIQLSPLVQLDAATTPTVTVTLKATDSGGLFVTKVFVFVVTPVAPPAGNGFSLGFSLGFDS